MKTNWIPTQVIVDPQLPFVTLVCVDDAAAPTKELTMRLNDAVLTTRNL